MDSMGHCFQWVWLTNVGWDDGCGPLLLFRGSWEVDRQHFVVHRLPGVRGHTNRYKYCRQCALYYDCCILYLFHVSYKHNNVNILSIVLQEPSDGACERQEDQKWEDT